MHELLIVNQFPENAFFFEKELDAQHQIIQSFARILISVLPSHLIDKRTQCPAKMGLVQV